FSAFPARCDSGSDLAYQLGRLGEPHRLVEGKHEVAVDFDIVDAAVAGDQPQVRERLAEFLEDRIRVLHRFRLISAGDGKTNYDLRHRSWGRGPFDKKVSRLVACGVVVAVHIEGGEAAEGVQEVPQPRPEGTLRGFERRRPRSPRCVHEPPYVRRAVFQAAVLA